MITRQLLGTRALCRLGWLIVTEDFAQLTRTWAGAKFVFNYREIPWTVIGNEMKKTHHLCGVRGMWRWWAKNTDAMNCRPKCRFWLKTGKWLPIGIRIPPVDWRRSSGRESRSDKVLGCRMDSKVPLPARIPNWPGSSHAACSERNQEVPLYWARIVDPAKPVKSKRNQVWWLAEPCNFT